MARELLIAPRAQTGHRVVMCLGPITRIWFFQKLALADANRASSGIGHAPCRLLAGKVSFAGYKSKINKTQIGICRHKLERQMERRGTCTCVHVCVNVHVDACTHTPVCTLLRQKNRQTSSSTVPGCGSQLLCFTHLLPTQSSRRQISICPDIIAPTAAPRYPGSTPHFRLAARTSSVEKLLAISVSLA